MQQTFVTCNAPCTRHTLCAVLDTHNGALDDGHTRRFLESVSLVGKHAKPSLKSVRDGNVPLATRIIKATSPERMLVIATTTGRANVMGYISANPSEWNEQHLQTCWGNYKHRRGNPTVAQKEEFKVQYDPKITTQIPVELPANAFATKTATSQQACLTLWSPDADTQEVLVVTDADAPLPKGCVLVKGGTRDGRVLHTPCAPVFDDIFRARVGLYEDIGTWSLHPEGGYTIVIVANQTKVYVPDSSVCAMNLRFNVKHKRKSTTTTRAPRARAKKPRNNPTTTPTKKHGNHSNHSCFDGAVDIMQLFEQLEDDDDAPVCIDDLFEEDCAQPVAPPTTQSVNITHVDQLSHTRSVATAALVLNDLSQRMTTADVPPSQRMTATVSLVEMPDDVQQPVPSSQRMTEMVSLVEMPDDVRKLCREEKAKQPTAHQDVPNSPSPALSLLSDTDDDETAFTKDDIDALLEM